MEGAFRLHGIKLPGIVYGLMVAAERRIEEVRLIFFASVNGFWSEGPLALLDITHLLVSGADPKEALCFASPVSSPQSKA